MTGRPAPAARVGRCGGVTSRGKCGCPGFVKGREIAQLIYCARPDCPHSQGVHAPVEAVAA